jgi:hypothetical protein
MANHLRRQIREAIGTAVTGLTTTSTRVYQSRVVPLQDTNLPALLIYTRAERSSPATVHGPRIVERTAEVEIVAVAKATSDIDDTLDGICKEVETALAWPVSGLATLAKDLRLVSTDLDLNGEGEKQTGSATLRYEVDYFNLENAPDTAT